MLLTRVLLGFLLVVFSAGPLVTQASSQEEHTEFWQFVRTVEDILAGKNTEQATAIIGKGARLIFGARFEDLHAVVTGEIRDCPLADTSYHGVMLQAQTNPSEDAGVLVLKTQKTDTTRVRFHSIVFMKDSKGEYVINIWHASD